MSTSEALRSRRRGATVVGVGSVAAVGLGAAAVAQPAAIVLLVALPLVALVPAVAVCFAAAADGVTLPLLLTVHSATAVNMAVLGATILAALVAVLRGRIDRRVGWPVLGMVALVLPATVLAVFELPSAQWLSGLRYVFIPLLVALLASTMTARTVRTVLRVLTTLLAVNAVVSGIESALGSDRLLALTGLSYGTNIRNIGTTLRAMGTFGTNYQLGAFAGVLGAVALLWWGTLEDARRDRVWRIVAIASGVACLVFSTYRTGIVVFVVAIAAAVFLTRGVVAGWVRVAAAVGGLLAVIGFLAVGLGNAGSLLERFAVWGQLLAASPRFFGRGLGFAGAASQAKGSALQVFTDDYYISMWLQFGVGGVLAIVLFLAVAVALYRAGRRGNRRAALAVTIWIGVLVGFFFVELWEYTSAMSIVMLVLGASGSHARAVDTGPVTVPAPRPSRRPL
ncbi:MULTISPECIES: hypothetical protein [unclassified Curtobacterium]|uniref:hypothetical protein n=1 Tax=unclassified Curtobacterium TaxID=257496 RepID=UPI000DA9063F|nr:MULTISPECIES: hypothetical protein [unclassified Curtobacterium]PZE29911.1 hypothetical protein DEI86_01085 [Curtobacterium sp. MCBD17_028]PZE74458.1 hypothetical protein DEI82_10480 [Curtobacterium sp. MCBD17_019]